MVYTKDRYGATELYSLAEYKVRNDASFEKDYLSGKYGAIPIVGDLTRLFNTQENKLWRLQKENMNPRIERKITRISGVREVKQTFLIICEGVNTEPDYFNAFRLTSATVKAIGQGMGTLALVQKAINIKEQERQRGRTYNQNWVVFDKDDFPENDFNSAILSARQNGFEVAYSNQAFEFWFLLHFNLYQGALHRSRYEKC